MLGLRLLQSGLKQGKSASTMIGENKGKLAFGVGAATYMAMVCTSSCGMNPRVASSCCKSFPVTAAAGQEARLPQEDGDCRSGHAGHQIRRGESGACWWYLQRGLNAVLVRQGKLGDRAKKAAEKKKLRGSERERALRVRQTRARYGTFCEPCGAPYTSKLAKTTATNPRFLTSLPPPPHP